MRTNRYAWAAVAGAAVLAVGGGTAIASKGTSGNPQSRCEALVERIAARRGITPAQLEANVKARLEARFDAALAAGRITADQAAALKQRIDNGNLCAAVRRARLRGGMVKTAADYLGLTRTQLRQQLPGTSLAALATKEGKNVEGLEAAMLAPAKARLDAAVKAGLLTQPQADAKLARLTRRVARLVTKTFPAT
jgi:hypothetical protein